MDIIHVPPVPGPVEQLCFATPPLDGSKGNPMGHCDRRKGHGGPHTWELVAALRQVKQTLENERHQRITVETALEDARRVIKELQEK